MRIIDFRHTKTIEALLDRGERRNASVERRVSAIVDRVRREGDRALLAYARRFDGLTENVEISRADMLAASASLPSGVREAIRRTARSIRHVARRQMPRGFTTEPVGGVV